MKKLYILLILFLIVLIVFIGIFSFRRSQLLYLYRTDPLPDNDLSEAVIEPIPVETEDEDLEVETVLPQEVELEKNLTFLILGLDSRQDNYTGRSDVIILVDVNHNNRTVKLISFMRDLRVEIEGHGFSKLGHAYAYGREKLAMETLASNFGLDIDEYIVLNFEDLKDMVNAFGGVEVEITSKESSQISGISTGGTYKLSGAQALQYVRIRNVGNGDFERTSRQRKILEVMMDMTKDLDDQALLVLIGQVYPLMETSFDIDEIYEALENDRGEAYQVSTIRVPDGDHISEKYLDGIYYLVIEDFEQLQNDISEFLNN